MHIGSRAVPILLVIPLTLGIAGCGAGSGRIPIHGMVTFKAQPVDKGTITFYPRDQAGQTTESALITNGKFALPTEKGLFPGTYRVEISAQDGNEPTGVPDGPPGPRNRERKEGLIPEKYNKQSILTIEVTDTGKRDFPFHLE